MAYFGLDLLLTKPRGSRYQNSGRGALRTEVGDFSYEQLNRRANQLAAGLRAHGVRRGDRIIVLLENRVEWFDVFFAAAKLGAVIVPANYFLVASEIKYLVEDSGARFTLTERKLVEKVEWMEQRSDLAGTLFVVDDSRPGWVTMNADRFAFDPAIELADAVGAEEPFLLQYTSGTTGFPKAAVHSQATILFNVLHQVSDYRVSARDTYVLIPPLCWSAGFQAFTLATLLTGGTVVLQPSRGIDPDRLTTVLDEHQGTIIGLAPLIMRRMLESEAFNRDRLPELRMIFTGSEPCPPELIEQLAERMPGCEILQIFGMSEGPFSGTFLEPENAITKVGAVGRGGLVTQTRVVDAELNDLPPGEVGELVVRSPGTAIGYWNRPEATAEAFTNGWFRTGDLGRIDDDGFLFIVGRSKDMILRGGLNIYPAEIERVLMQHPAVEEVAVVGTPDDMWGQVPTAVIRPKAPTGPDELDEFARGRLAKFKVPQHWVLVDEPLPRTISGKLQKFEVLKLVAARSPAQG